VVRIAAAVVTGVVLAAAIASCTLFEDDIPDRSCRSNDDCFRAQGEVCDVPSQTCVIGPDAAPMIDATVTP
jgi:hypothetical protein